jgi:ABC-type Fe3+ transport system permease subunit
VVAVVGVLTFATAARATSIVALLASRDTQPLSLVQLGHIADGDFEKASVIGVLMLLLTIGVALAGRLLGLRIRAGQSVATIAGEIQSGEGKERFNAE